jgi:hypothetical protein
VALPASGRWRRPNCTGFTFPATPAAGRAGAFPRGAAGQQAAASLAEAHQRAILAEQRLSDAKAALEERKADRDAWREQAQRLAISAPETRRSCWRRLTGG